MWFDQQERERLEETFKMEGGRKAEPVVVQKSGKEKRRALKERLTLKVCGGVN